MFTIAPLKLLPYDVAVFQRLSDFFIARDSLEQHRENISAIGQVICSFEMEDNVAVNLLHKHFEIDSDELCVREFADDKAFIKPYKIAEQLGVLPYLWTLAEGQFGRGFYPLEFVTVSDDEWRKEALFIIESMNRKEGFLESIASKLEELKLFELFGIAALFSRRPFELDDDASVLETSDESNRILTLRPERNTEIKSSETTQTLWTFNAQPKRNVSGRSICGSHCISHCNHCLSHGQPRYTIPANLGEI